MRQDGSSCSPSDIPLDIREEGFVVYVDLAGRLNDHLPFHKAIEGLLTNDQPLLIITPHFSDQIEIQNGLEQEMLDITNFSDHRRTSFLPINIVKYVDGSVNMEEAALSRSDVHMHENYSTEVTNLHELPPFKFLEQCYQNPHETSFNKADTTYYINRPYVSDANRTSLESSIMTRIFSHDHDSTDTSGAFRSTCKSYLHPGKFRYNSKSLSSFATSVNFEGCVDEYVYLKWNFASFNLHFEQEALPFYHHQLFGHSIWIVIHPSDRDQIIPRIIKPMVRQYYAPDSLPSDSALDHLARILFLVKRIFPPLSVLKESGLRYQIIRVNPGQILLGCGDLAHCGFGLKGNTISVACNLVSEGWLQHTKGVDYIQQHFQWLQLLMKLLHVGTTEQRNDIDQPIRLNEHPYTHHILDDLPLVINHCPPNHSCNLLVGLMMRRLYNITETDERIVQHDVARAVKQITQAYFETNADEEVKVIFATIQLIHQLHPFFNGIAKLSSSSSFKICDKKKSSCFGLIEKITSR